ncbi:phosphopantetheine-binding protein [Phytohabitans houttuyneae]|jgi:aryl carrier-like protein|uniref:Carrier domain-containing protein n=1 Tax=Phytohabitans houttuyneae TaxID=1076126 RepID=A0A6V8JYL2_9ACTN|nr:phosphopantetheine-binding protein [Phytohabitans houttuyneae]GFJ77832.1 hypothetical protein Phou_020120 [Phytohabitans houttuyneae]
MSVETGTQRDVLEVVLVHCWESTLRKKPIGVDDNFFALGGHSLAAMRVATRLRKSLGVTVDYGMVLEHLTVAALARALRDSGVPSSELDRAGHAYVAEHGLAA